jgi:hypothetical protein
MQSRTNRKSSYQQQSKVSASDTMQNDVLTATYRVLNLYTILYLLDVLS